MCNRVQGARARRVGRRPCYQQHVRVDIVTLFPELFAGFLNASFVGRAIEGGQLVVRLRSPREFGLGKHRAVDVHALRRRQRDGHARGRPRGDDRVGADRDAPEGRAARRVLLTPQGRVLDQARVHAFAALDAVMLVCGRYEGFDERVRTFVDEEVSLGDFVMTGGEVAAMAVIDACVRLLPGVLGNEASTLEESHSPAAGGLLEYPHFTRPADFRGAGVPEVLVGGNHAQIARWRREQAVARTRERRPDLWARFEREQGEHK